MQVNTGRSLPLAGISDVQGGLIHPLTDVIKQLYRVRATGVSREALVCV